MIKSAKLFLVQKEATLKDLAPKMNISLSTLSYTMRHPVSEWRIGFLIKLANATGESPNQLFQYFVDGSNREEVKRGSK